MEFSGRGRTGGSALIPAPPELVGSVVQESRVLRTFCSSSLRKSALSSCLLPPGSVRLPHHHHHTHIQVRTYTGENKGGRRDGVHMCPSLSRRQGLPGE